MNGCLAAIGLLSIHFAMSCLVGFSLSWYSGIPSLSLFVISIYWWFVRIYWKMGASYLANAAVVATAFSFLFGWIEWRQPVSIAIHRYAKGDTDKALRIVGSALPDDPESVPLHVARHQIALYTLDTDVVREEVRFLSTSLPMANASKVLECELQMLEADPLASLTRVSKQIDATPLTFLYSLRGSCRLSLNDLPHAEEDFRKVAAECERGPLAWVISGATYVEVRYLAAYTHMQLSHVARRQGKAVAARESIQAAVKEFESGQFVRSLEPPGSCLFIPREQFVGSLVYAWAEALTEQAGDAASLEALTKSRQMHLRGSARDLRGFVRSHLEASSSPSRREEIEGFRSADLRE